MTNPAQAPFIPGDRVQRKIGGPMMTFVREGPLGEAICAVDRDGGAVQESFTYHELRRWQRPAEPRVDYTMKH